MTLKSILLAGAAFLAAPTIALAQAAEPPPRAAQPVDQPGPGAQDDPSGQAPDTGPSVLREVVVTGQRRGSVRGVIPPENVLTREDVRATGAIDISELVEALGARIGTARGRGGEAPVLLLNGRRISGYRELRDIPTDAITRVEILPEEVALAYGYRADQRVMNVVLSEHFRSIAALIRGGAASEGGYADGAADFTHLTIDEARRTTFNIRAEAAGGLTEDERDVISNGAPDPASAARSLLGSAATLRGTITHYRQVGPFGATGNVELEHKEGRMLLGPGATSLRPLARDTASDSARAGFVVNGDVPGWYWSAIGDAEASRSVTGTDVDASGVRDRAATDTLRADLDAMAGGALFRLPAGDAGATVRIGAGRLELDSEYRRDGLTSSSALGRTRADASVSFDLPVSRRGGGFAALGNLALNGNARVEQLSDFGTLTTVGAGAYWSPAPRLDLSASWTVQEGAPTIQQLGEPRLETPDARVFDFTTGDMALVMAITGGDSRLEADRRHVMKLAANWKPFEARDLRLHLDYVRSRLSDPISDIPGPTPALEAAFPDRFMRDSTGALVSADLRPVNFDSARRDTLRLGFDFSMPLRSTPTEAEPRFLPDEPLPPGKMPDPFPAGGGPEPVRILFGPGDGSRLGVSLTDTITLVDAVTIRDGLKLDYLRGDALGQSGGRPRHEVEGRFVYSDNGRGAFLSANWRSGTSVTTATGRDIRFSPQATFDLRLFSAFDPRSALVSRHPWLEGASVHLEVKNLLNSRPTARDRFGDVPPGFQPDLLDPLGRTISITFRRGGGGIGG